MTNIIEEAEIINKFLCQIKKSLPLGIKLKKNEINDILDEIEEHIWEKAIENAGDKEPNEIDVQIAISQMGEPRDIASKFTSKSSPHVYISEELYPYYREYRKRLLWASILTIILPFLYQIINTFGYYYNFYYFNLLYLYLNFCLSVIFYFNAFVILRIIFYYLSNTGYTPYKFRKSKIQEQQTKIINIQEPKFRQFYRNIALYLEFFLIILILIFLKPLPYYFSITSFSIISIVKCLRVFTKKKSIIWQRFLIIIDVLFEGLIFFSTFLSFLFIFYLLYEIHLFTTLKEKLDSYLKEVSLNKRIYKKKIILRSINKDDELKEQNIFLENDILISKSSKSNNEFEELIKGYLKKVKRKLPFWLKKEEKNEILKTHVEEIREATLESENYHILKQKSLIQNINDLGFFKSLLSDYRNQGSPKIYISKELWSWYLSTLKSILTYILVILFSLGAIFSIIVHSLSIFVYIFLSLLLLIIPPIVILTTQFFIFLSLNDFIPKNNKIGNNFYYIWELLFAGFFIEFGILLLFSFISGNFTSNSFNISISILVSVLLLILGGIKIFKGISGNKTVKLRFVLITLSLSCSLVINFFINMTYYSGDLLTYIVSRTIFSDLLLLTINIELIYEIFQFYFKK
ncbi:MAG: hypothetical protein ACFFC3_02480 [Candidatus Odinarchaeota archaeon]